MPTPSAQFPFHLTLCALDFGVSFAGFDLLPLTTLIVWHSALIFAGTVLRHIFDIGSPAPPSYLFSPQDNGEAEWSVLDGDIIFTLLKTCSRNWFSASPGGGGVVGGGGTFQTPRELTLPPRKRRWTHPPVALSSGKFISHLAECWLAFGLANSAYIYFKDCNFVLFSC